MKLRYFVLGQQYRRQSIYYNIKQFISEKKATFKLKFSDIQPSNYIQRFPYLRALCLIDAIITKTVSGFSRSPRNPYLCLTVAIFVFAGSTPINPWLDLLARQISTSLVTTIFIRCWRQWKTLSDGKCVTRWSYI